MMPRGGERGHAAIDAVVEGLAVRGYAVVGHFLDAAAIAALRARARALERVGALVPARVGRGGDAVLRADIRGDRTRWLDPADAAPAEVPLHEALEALRGAANRELALGLFEFEGHYALYPRGARYARHRDRFRDDDARVLSVVLYLNDRWRADEGGALRLHVDEGAPLDVAPAGGTLAAFLAARFDHEVLPATRPRLSIAGWFRRRA
jgi:SM-20-related protein